jgi:lipoyl(octanoyl) transferase
LKPTELPLLRFTAPQHFRPIADLQRSLADARFRGRIPDLILLLEHHPVITLGRRARDEFLRVPREQARAQGLEIEIADRGGDITWHGPGQFVLYPILRLTPGRASMGHLTRLEAVALETARAFGVPAFRRDGIAGAWTEHGKLAAIGFRIRHGVTYHGLSFNVRPDLSGFDLIVPCGLVNEKVTSLGRQLDSLNRDCPSMHEVAEAMGGACESVMERNIRPCVPGETSLPGEVKRLMEEYREK